MDVSQQILSSVIVHNKYAKHIPELNRREDWEEICDRNMQMHIHKFPALKKDIQDVYRNFVKTKKVLPSMRSMQFAGTPIELSNSRIFNCFGRETKFITSAGTKSFEDFNDGDEVLVPTHTGEWKKAVVRSYGEQSLNSVKFSKGATNKTVRVTGDHRWLKHDGSETTNLSVGDTLVPTPDISQFNYDDANPLERLWSVSEITNHVAMEVVWCLEVEDNHSFLLTGGIVTGNCAYTPMDHPFAFAELMFLLLGGTGVGYSVQHRHIDKLPVIVGPSAKNRRFLIGDSIEGWADSIKVLIKSYTTGKSNPVFDFRDIRAKGSLLKTSGGRAPGPDPLRLCIEHLRSILNGAIGRQLTSLEVHDMCCHIADAVLAGGIRRAAMICGFDCWDMDMMSCKTGKWYEEHPQRGRCNNSVVLKRGEVSEEEFKSLWKLVELSGAGEPGIFWTNDYDVFTNPCAEISLYPNQFCNLTTTNVSDVVSQEDLNDRVRAAAFLGTLQAAYTDFHYLRQIWKETTERDALIGVSMTGIGSGAVLAFNLAEAAEIVLQTNALYAEKLGINPAARTTTIKPEGTASCAVGSASGIHAWHNDYYIRRIRIGKSEPLYKYLLENIPELVEDDFFKPHLEAVISIPQHAPIGSILRTESALHLLKRVAKFNMEWVRPGYRSGANHHNVSCTISVKPHEWERVGEWMWNNQDLYTGIAVIPYDGGTYVQAPFTDCTQEEYEALLSHCRNIDLTKVLEINDTTSLSAELACAGGACEITF